MENTAENKFKYFAQHYGQKVLVTPSEMKVKVNSNSLIDSIVNLGYLQLTPLSDITETQLAVLAEVSGTTIGSHFLDDFKDLQEFKKALTTNNVWSSNTVDKIREFGIAYEWNGLSIETLISYNWLKLKTA